jgi:hypothetical protein
MYLSYMLMKYILVMWKGVDLCSIECGDVLSEKCFPRSIGRGTSPAFIHIVTYRRDYRRGSGLDDSIY